MLQVVRIGTRSGLIYIDIGGCNLQRIVGKEGGIVLHLGKSFHRSHRWSLLQYKACHTALPLATTVGHPFLNFVVLC